MSCSICSIWSFAGALVSSPGTWIASGSLLGPPKGQLPFPSGSSRTAPGCNVRDLIFDAALAINPAFDIYRIFDTVGFSVLCYLLSSTADTLPHLPH